jgi:hypothetical protein
MKHARVAHEALILAAVFCVAAFACQETLTSARSVISVNGLSTAMQSDPSAVGQWSAPATWPIVPVHISLLPNGKVLFWTRDKTMDGRNTVGNAKAYIWDPALGTMTFVPNFTTNLFCSGHSFLPDGRLLVTGGHAHPDFDGLGEKHTNVFDFSTNTWTRLQDMNNGRWYPYNVTLANGETLVVSGNYWDGTFVNTQQGPRPRSVRNQIPQILNGQGAWRDLTDAVQPSDVALYPWLHLMTDGRVFVSGPQRQSYYLDPNGTGLWTPVASTSFPHDIGGSSVMYELGKVMNVGGFAFFQGPPTNATEVIDLTVPTPSWRTASPLNFKRVNHTATVLPDGKVLVTGGSECSGSNNIDCSEGAVFAAEMWDPATEQWSILASNQVPRLYHSVALLLPDARVLVGGGGLPAAVGESTGSVPPDLFGHNDVEIFTPPYLLNPDGSLKARPSITHTPSFVSYAQNFFVETPGSTAIAKVSLVRLPSVTHTFNQDQRIVFLGFTRVSGGLNVIAPANGNFCPPGHYMMFLVDSNGVPSRAAIVQVLGAGSPPPPCSAIPAPGNLVATAISTTQIDLRWTAPLSSQTRYEVQRSHDNQPFVTLTSNYVGTTYRDNVSGGSTVTYLYRVRAFDTAGNCSGFSGIDLATNLIFVDDPLLIGQTIIKAVHVSQLRDAVSALRRSAGLGQVTWTDPLLPGIPVKALHIQQLRTGVDQGRATLAVPTPPYTDSTLVPFSTVVRAIHVHELRQRVK